LEDGIYFISANFQGRIGDTQDGEDVDQGPDSSGEGVYPRGIQKEVDVGVLDGH